MRNGFTRFLTLLALSVVAAVHAQLPTVDLPRVPLPRVETGPVLREVGTLGRLPTRALRIDRLLARHRPELDRDNRGELVVRAEVVGIDVSDDALRKALAKNFRVVRTRELADLGILVTVLGTPEGMTARRGLAVLRKLDPEGEYDYNHVYLDAGDVEAGIGAAPLAAAQGAAAIPGHPRIGLIDGGVDTRHSALARVTVHAFGCGGDFFPDPHGTSVASVMTPKDAAVELFAADVYCGRPDGGAVDSMAAAFGWLAREKVAVINVSLVGPRNALLQRVVATLVARGHVIVAAVGNDGPAAPPLFPAAYEGVVGVTAVDEKRKVLLEACRGEHVDFAALGAGLDGATLPPDGWAAVRGTSFAAPAVALQLAWRVPAPDAALRDRVLAELASAAIDLGRSGRDDIYGAGLLGGT